MEGIRPGFPGGGFAPRALPNPAIVRGEFQRLMPFSPGKVLTNLSGEHAAVLPHAERVALGRQAIRGLTLRIEKGGNTWGDLAEVRAVRRNGAGLGPELGRELKGLQQLAERRALVEVLAEVQPPAERGNWGEAAGKANEALPRLKEPPLGERGLESAEFRAQRQQVREALEEVASLGRRLEALDRLQLGLQAVEGNRPTEAATALERVDLEALPASLRGPAKALRGLARVREQAGQRWREAPDVAALKEGVAHFREALAGLPDVDARLPEKILQDLAFKALLEGHGAEVPSLLPHDGPAEHAATLLRDLHALGTGEGTVSSWAGLSALPTPRPGAGPASPRGPPPGLEPLMPEGARASWRPPARESARAGLEPLEDAAKVGQTIGARAEADARAERGGLDATAQAARTRLAGLQQDILKPEQAERRLFAEAEAALDRRLRPEERVLVRELAGQHKTAPQIVAAVRAQPGAADDEDDLLKDLQARLGRNLTADERAQALRLGKAGRRAAEIADIFRGPVRP
jgi:hypothetical protein